MSLASQCAKRFQANSSNFSIDHILNVAGRKQNFKSSNFSPVEDGKFEWLNCTRYRPPKLPRQGKKEGIQRRKLGRNPRIPFSSAQVAFLEAKFLRTPYLSSTDVASLAAYLKLSETRVKIWFQNRRARERREKESKSKGEEVSTKPARKAEQQQTTTTTVILPLDLPKCFPLDYSHPSRHRTYPDSFHYLKIVSPLDLSEQQLVRRPK